LEEGLRLEENSEGKFEIVDEKEGLSCKIDELSRMEEISLPAQNVQAVVRGVRDRQISGARLPNSDQGGLLDCSQGQSSSESKASIIF